LDNDDRVAAAVDSYGRMTTFTYDNNGFVNGRANPAGQTVTWTKSLYGNPLVVTHPDGGTEVWMRDPEDRVQSHTDTRTNTTTFTWDPAGRVVTLIQHPDATTEEFTYNNFGQVLTHKLRNGGTWTYTYDARGLKTQADDPLGHATIYTYDAADRLASVRDARNNTTALEYNDRGLLTKITFPGGATRMFGYDAFGHKTSETNELGKTWTYTYDAFGRLSWVMDPLNRVTYYGYSAIGQVSGGSCATCAGDKPSSITLPSGKQIAITYDLEGNKKTVTVGANTAEAATTTYTYDAVGNLVASTDPRGKTSQFNYDPMGRVASATDPLSQTTSWTYDAAGNKLSEQKPDGTTTSYAYDSMNQVTSITDALSQTTALAYSAGNLVLLTDARNNSYAFNSDALGRRTGMIYPDASVESYAYDPAGNLVSYTTRAGQTKTTAYDNRNRVTAYSWSDGTPGATMTYDDAGRLLTLNSSVSALSYTYDDANQLLSETQNLASTPLPLAVSYTYDADGNRTGLTYPDGTVVSYAYTGRNELASVSATSYPSPLASYQYDAAGNRIAKTLANGVTTTYERDDASQLTALSSQLSAISYGYNTAGNRDSKTQTDAGQASRTEIYGYDVTSQLTDVNYNNERAVSYTYDAVGNRAQVSDNGTPIPYGAANALNQYSSVNNSPVAYDSNGDLTQLSSPDSQLTCIYDAQNRLVLASSASVAVNFVYDARNRCVRRWAYTLGNWEVLYDHYLYYDGWNLIEERDAAANQVARYIHGADVDEILTLTTSIFPSSPLYYSQDALGSVTHLSDASGTLVESYTYDAFGQPAVYDSSAIRIPQSAFGNRFAFTGREWLAEIGLYDYRNRVYSPTLGRFLQTDPIRFGAGDVNIYRYVGNDSANTDDPFGLNGRRGIVRQRPIRSINVPRTAAEELREEQLRREAQKRGIDPDYKPTGPYRPPEIRAAPERESCPLRHNRDQSALHELAERAQRTGITTENAETLLEWAKEYRMEPALDHMNADHWIRGPHVRIGTVNHIPVRQGSR